MNRRQLLLAAAAAAVVPALPAEAAPDSNCITTPDGGCVGAGCMHDVGYFTSSGWRLTFEDGTVHTVWGDFDFLMEHAVEFFERHYNAGVDVPRITKIEHHWREWRTEWALGDEHPLRLITSDNTRWTIDCGNIWVER